MTRSLGPDQSVFVVGAGIMGAGIAQVAAQAGHRVGLHDERPGAAAAALAKLGKTLDGLVAKGRLEAAEATAIAGRIEVAGSLDPAAGCGLVVEAIVENLDAKRGLFRDLEAVVAAGCVLASNTSSISITALANGLERPGRLVGMHFFNPVPLMKLVEVVSGLATDPAVAEAIFTLAKAWGKTPVHARSTPGFIVNRIARPYYAEAFALLQERAVEPAVLDACLRGAGFRMGPCELMDLIGHDTNFAVTESVFAANFGDKRYQPSLVQREMIDGGLLGRKSGRGFYSYPAPTNHTADPASQDEPIPTGVIVALHGTGIAVERWSERLAAAGVRFEADPSSRWHGLQTANGDLRLTDGRPAAQVAAGRRRPRAGGVRLCRRPEWRPAQRGAGLHGRGQRLGGLARRSPAMAPHRRLVAAADGRRARADRRPRGGHARQRSLRRRAARRLHARRRGPGDEAGRQLPGRAVRMARADRRRQHRRADRSPRQALPRRALSRQPRAAATCLGGAADAGAAAGPGSRAIACFMTTQRPGTMTDSQRAPRTTQFEVEVRFGDCDPVGIVFFPNFLRWMDAASLSFFMQCGLPPWRELGKTRGIVGTPLLEINTRFVNAATYGEKLSIATHVAEWRSKVIVQMHRVTRGDTLICEGREVRAFVKRDADDPDRLRAIPVPDDIRALCEWRNDE